MHESVQNTVSRAVTNSQLEKKTSADAKARRKKKTSADVEEALPVEGPVDERLWKVPSISVRVMDLEHFKNRYGIDDKHHIIEVLRASPHMSDDIQAEWNRRQEKNDLHETTSLQMGDNIQSGPEYIQRVRIQSPVILGYFSHVTGYTGGDIEKPRVFFWPFAGLVHFHSEMKDQLEFLEEQWGATTPLEDFEYIKDDPAEQFEVKKKDVPGGGREIAKGKRVESGPGGARIGARQKAGASSSVRNDAEWVSSPAGIDRDDVKASEENSNDTDIENLLDTPTALRHMRCFIEFVERMLLPLEKAAMDHFESSGKIKSNDLWHLFQLGDVIYVASNSLLQRQTTFVVYRKAIPPIDDDYPDDFSNRGLTLLCYYVDNDGDRYGKTSEGFWINGYEGEKAITDLPMYPLRYAQGHQQQHVELQRHGQHFMAMVKEKHVYCQGWTLPNSPTGQRSGEEKRLAYSPPEHIDSDVIIDIKEALNKNPDWKPILWPNGQHLTGDSWQVGNDKMEVCHWRDKSRAQLLVSIPEKIQREEAIADAMGERWEGMPSIGSFDLKSENDVTIPSGILVLPRRFFAYVLRDRKFASVDVMMMEKIPPQQYIFDDLEIDENNKRMVKSLVAEHFQKRELQRIRPGIGLMNQDLIRGKGLGLFILLHGVPGCGKTATAEAVAQANGKPLFAITCGDLGFTPKEVEEELNSIFRLANMWDCVLLLDEADVFLARRDSWNLKRNALVSVFLRVLEYYSGILFLTTNRVGTIDEAFKSRIHVSLYYDRLDLNQTEKIFQININKLNRMERDKENKLKESGVRYPRLQINQRSILEWARNYYNDANRTGEFMQWNGRQIRNAFQVAASLARYDTTKEALASGGEKVPCPTLGARQFQSVAQAIEKFDTYMEHATGMADSDHARIEGTRADGIEFKDEMQLKASSRAAAKRSSGSRPDISRQNDRGAQEKSSARYHSLLARSHPGRGGLKGKSIEPSVSRRFNGRNEEIGTEHISDEDSEHGDEANSDGY
ncbi:hypothetical protein HDV57DRAFT_494086 [Trichoderma longibrachiatum]